MRPVTALEMARIDAMAQETFGISQHALMESAGCSAFEEIKKSSASLTNKKVFIFAGKGNNAGDGFVLARYLDRAGVSVKVFLCFDGEVKEGAAADNLKTARRAEIPLRPITDFLQNSKHVIPDLFVDAIFGTGFKGSLPEVLQEVSKRISSFSQRTISLDIPSGLNATDGSASRNCFRAGKTISFGLPKAGFYKAEGPRICGEVIIKDIGFPGKLLEPYL